MGTSLNALIASGGAQYNDPLGVAGRYLNLWSQGQQLQASRYELGQARLQPALGQFMALSNNPNASWDDVAAALASSARIGGDITGLTADMNAAKAGQGPRTGSGQPEQPIDYIRRQALQGIPAFERMQGITPSVQAIDTPTGRQYITVGAPFSQTPGAVTPQGFAPSGGLSVAQLAQPHDPWVDAQGGMHTGTWADWYRFQGIDPSTLTYRPGTQVPAAGAPAAGAAGAKAAPGDFGGFIDDAAAESGIPAPILASVMKHESSFNPGEINKQSDARGLMQILPNTFKNPGYDMAAGTGDIMDPETNIHFGANYLAARGRALFGDQWNPNDPRQMAAAIEAYNGGAGYAPAVIREAGAATAGGVLPMRTTPAVATGAGGAPVIPAAYTTPIAPAIPGPSAGTAPPPWVAGLWEQSAKDFAGDRARETGLSMRLQPWQSALSILKANPDLQTGPTSDQWNRWAATLSQWGITLPSMPANSVQAYQELGKNLARALVTQNAASGPTDMARLENEASMPSTQMTPDTIRALVARQIGYERFQVARFKYFKQLHAGQSPSQFANTYTDATNDWYSGLDPVAFGADNMTNQDIADYEKGLAPAEKENFRRSVTEAAKLYPDVARAGQ